MTPVKNVLMFWLICHSFFSFELESCTRVFWNNNSQAKIVSRTMDLFTSDEPQIWVNPRGTRHLSTIDDRGLEWCSLYGNVSISAFNIKNLISEGLNEEGFAVHALVLATTQYEKRDHRPGLHYGEWLQYLLDTCQTVKEALEAHHHFQVVPIAVNGFVWPIHLMMEDATGDSAIIEFVEGKLKVYHDPNYRVGTNDPTYDKHLKNLRNYEEFGGTRPLPTKTDSMSRFVIASTLLKQMPDPKNRGEALALTKTLMDEVYQRDSPSKDISFIDKDEKSITLWTSILDLTHLIFYFIPTGRPEGLRLDFADLNFYENSPTKVEVNNLNFGFNKAISR